MRLKVQERECEYDNAMQYVSQFYDFHEIPLPHLQNRDVTLWVRYESVVGKTLGYRAGFAPAALSGDWGVILASNCVTFLKSVFFPLQMNPQYRRHIFEKAQWRKATQYRIHASHSICSCGVSRRLRRQTSLWRRSFTMQQWIDVSDVKVFHN